MTLTINEELWVTAYYTGSVVYHKHGVEMYRVPERENQTRGVESITPPGPEVSITEQDFRRLSVILDRLTKEELRHLLIRNLREIM